jgi:Holliday junction DNA helicase RuvA
MISYIKGDLISISPKSAVIFSHGIGYEVYCTTSDLLALSSWHKKIQIYTHLSHKENEMKLYGFLQEEKKKLFLKLIKINGVGESIAIKILSSYSTALLIRAIKQKNKKILTDINGIGDKMAEKILGLKLDG